MPSSSPDVAYAYNLIAGFEDGTFRPMEKITREQAMAIIAKAMALTNLPSHVKPAEALLQPYADAAQASDWAKTSI